MHGSAKELTAYQAAGLSVMAVHNPKPGAFTGTGLPDDCFIRGSVPMTKREIRASVVSRIAPAKNACIYDIGAGTGSVTVELAMQALYGCVYAVERTEEGCSLIAQNAHKFGLDNIQVVHGSAAGVLENCLRRTRYLSAEAAENWKTFLKSFKEESACTHCNNGSYIRNGTGSGTAVGAERI